MKHPFTLAVVTAPTAEPISLDEAKRHIRDFVTTDQDDVIVELIKACRMYAENYCKRAFVTQTLRWSSQCLPDNGRILLPRPPLQSVTGITYTDLNGDRQTVDPTLYAVATDSEPGVVYPVYNEVWPSSRNYDPDAWQVTYVAGYAAQAQQNGQPLNALTKNVPSTLKVWMKMKMAHFYEFREPVITGTILSRLAHNDFDGLLDNLVCDLLG